MLDLHALRLCRSSPTCTSRMRASAASHARRAAVLVARAALRVVDEDRARSERRELRRACARRGDQHLRAGVADREREPLGGMVGIERQIRAAGLQDRERGHDCFRRSLEHERDTADRPRRRPQSSAPQTRRTSDRARRSSACHRPMRARCARDARQRARATSACTVASGRYSTAVWFQVSTTRPRSAADSGEIVSSRAPGASERAERGHEQLAEPRDGRAIDPCDVSNRATAPIPRPSREQRSDAASSSLGPRALREPSPADGFACQPRRELARLRHGERRAADAARASTPGAAPARAPTRPPDPSIGMPSRCASAGRVRIMERTVTLGRRRPGRPAGSRDRGGRAAESVWIMGALFDVRDDRLDDRHRHDHRVECGVAVPRRSCRKARPIARPCQVRAQALECPGAGRVVITVVQRPAIGVVARSIAASSRGERGADRRAERFGRRRPRARALAPCHAPSSLAHVRAGDSRRARRGTRDRRSSDPTSRGGAARALRSRARRA